MRAVRQRLGRRSYKEDRNCQEDGGEGRGKMEISPQRSFIKVGSYDVSTVIQ